MIKIAFLDVDGTMLAFGAERMSERTVAALEAARANGILLYISTGRHIPQLHGLTDFEFDGIISLNGQYCLSAGEIVHRQAIPREDIQNLLAYLREEPFACAFIEDAVSYANLEDQRFEKVSKLISLDIPVLEDYEKAAEKDILQCLFFLDEESQHGPLSVMPGVSYTRWHEDFIDVVPLGGSKGIGVQAVLNHHGLKPGEALAIGDGENDISMLEAVGTAVAMGNASETVRSHADYVTKTVDEEGVWHSFRHFGLIG